MMESYYLWNLTPDRSSMEVLLLTVCGLFATAFILWRVSWLSYSNIPPGPRPWPIIGNILGVRKQGLISLAEKYGPIYSVWLGSRPCIVVSGAELMHDALINQGEYFSERCQLYSSKHISCNFKTVNTSDGPLWRTLRRNLMLEVLNSTRVKEYKHVRDSEFQHLVEMFKEEARSNDGVVQVMPLLRRTLFNILNTMCFGERVEENAVRKLDYLMAERFKRFRGSLADYFFIWRLVEWRKVRDVKAIIKQTDELLMPSLVKMREAIRNGETVSGRYLETLVQMQEKEGRDRFTDEHIFALCGEVLNGGTDTTARTIEWVLARIACDPDIQRKLVEEIETVLGEKTIEESDIESLPYLRAIVRETQRMYGPFLFGLPHAVSRSGVKLGGFDIPKNAQVTFIISSVSHDPTIWGDPENFRPERFLNEMASVDFTGTKTMALIPFGAGKRICPGMNLALLTTHMIVGLLVQTFEWSNGEPGEVDLTPGDGTLQVMRKPLKARIRERERSTLNIATTLKAQ